MALEAALELEEKVALVMGKRNGIYASCLNNIALMHKLVSCINSCVGCQSGTVYSAYTGILLFRPLM